MSCYHGPPDAHQYMINNYSCLFGIMRITHSKTFTSFYMRLVRDLIEQCYAVLPAFLMTRFFFSPDFAMTNTLILYCHAWLIMYISSYQLGIHPHLIIIPTSIKVKFKDMNKEGWNFNCLDYEWVSTSTSIHGWFAMVKSCRVRSYDDDCM